MKHQLINKNEKIKIVAFEAEDVNDPEWDEIIQVLKAAGIETRFADGNWMNFAWIKIKH